MWPLNFDPVWLLECDGFSAKDEDERASPLPDDDRVWDAVEHNNFAMMRQEGRDHKQMRKGKVGDWKEEREPATVQELERRCTDVMEYLHYEQHYLNRHTDVEQESEATARSPLDVHPSDGDAL